MGWKGEMTPRDSMREVLTKFGTDPPQAQGESNVQKTPDRWKS